MEKSISLFGTARYAFSAEIIINVVNYYLATAFFAASAN
jgi:hypothetical protein